MKSSLHAFAGLLWCALVSALLAPLLAHAYEFDIFFTPKRIKQGTKASFTIELDGTPSEPVFKFELEQYELQLINRLTMERTTVALDPIIELIPRGMKYSGVPMRVRTLRSKAKVVELSPRGVYQFQGILTSHMYSA
jgi:hypothetical protein